MAGARGSRGMGRRWVKWVKMYKRPVIKYVSNEDAMSSIMTTVNTALHTWSLLKEQISNVPS